MEGVVLFLVQVAEASGLILLTVIALACSWLILESLLPGRIIKKKDLDDRDS